MLVVGGISHLHESLNQLGLELPIVDLLGNELEEENDEDLQTPEVRQQNSPSLVLGLRLNLSGRVKKVGAK